MNFRKNSKRPLNPPPPPILVSENYAAFFFCKIFTFLRKFMAKLPFMIGTMSTEIFWIRNYTPPLEVFRKFIQICDWSRPLAGFWAIMIAPLEKMCFFGIAQTDTAKCVAHLKRKHCNTHKRLALALAMCWVKFWMGWDCSSVVAQKLNGVTWKRPKTFEDWNLQKQDKVKTRVAEGRKAEFSIITTKTIWSLLGLFCLWQNANVKCCDSGEVVR